jgi:hypothetical protein
MEGEEVLCRIDLCGFHVGRGLTWGGRGSTAVRYTCVFPYPPAAAIPTLIAGWLLLSKQPGRQVEPIAAQEAPHN